MTPMLIRAAILAGATLAAAPLAAQNFVTPECPVGSARLGNECVAANGIVTKSFVMPQIEDRQVYDLTSDSLSGQTDLQSGDRAVIADDSLFVTDLDTNLTVVAD